MSWSVDRDVFNEEASKLRARFDTHRGVNPAAAARLLQVRKTVRGAFLIAEIVF